jgi:hypothetical protein
MSKKKPPVPAENRSPKGTGSASEPRDEKKHRRDIPENTAEQGRQGNIRQNTRNQGHQQDR